MEGIITSFRRGKHTQYKNQMIIKVNAINTKEKAKSLVGKTVNYITPLKKEIKGKITNPHGNSGCVRALFEKGMPGQSLLQKIKIG